MKDRTTDLDCPSIVLYPTNAEMVSHYKDVTYYESVHTDISPLSENFRKRLNWLGKLLLLLGQYTLNHWREKKEKAFS